MTVTSLPVKPRRTAAERVRASGSAARGLSAVGPGSKILWVTSTGGHLSELSLLDQRLSGSPESVWVTFDTDQSRGFLADRRHLFVDYVAPRDLGSALRAAGRVARLLRQEKFDACISTGAAVAGTVLPMVAAVGLPTFYVESLARPHGPSVTGRLLALAPGVQTCTQYSSWASDRWYLEDNSLDGWTATSGAPVERPLKVLVTLGTIAPYRFDRAVDALLPLLRPDDEVVWQLGCTRRTDLPGTVLDQVSPQSISDLALSSDVTVTHSGVGSILQQLELGKSPVLAVRSSSHGEHVDDHQTGIAELTRDRGLTSVLDLEHPTRSSLTAAAARTVVRSAAPQLAYAA